MPYLPLLRPHERTFDCPTADEVAIVVLGDLDQATKRQDVISYKHTSFFERLNSAHRCYDPLLYVLLFPHNADGWNMQLKHTAKQGNIGGSKTLRGRLFQVQVAYPGG